MLPLRGNRNRSLLLSNREKHRGDQRQAESQGVSGNDPLSVGRGRTQKLLDGRQRDIDDRHVKHCHETHGWDDDKGHSGVHSIGELQVVRWQRRLGWMGEEWVTPSVYGDKCDTSSHCHAQRKVLYHRKPGGCPLAYGSGTAPGVLPGMR